jgi:hypothetical protein
MTRTLVTAAFMIGVIGAAAGAPQRNAALVADVTQAEYDRWKKELSNWGRWGKDDQLGTLNLVTAAKRRAAAALVKDASPCLWLGMPTR